MSNILPRSAIAATNHGNKIKIYFQAYNGLLLETYTDDGTNFHRSKDPLPTPSKPKTFTPIAAVSYHEGREVRVYYLTTDFHVQELAWSQGKGWYPGELNNLNVQTASYTRLAVVHYEEKFRVYYQRASDNKILEIVNDGPKWVHGSTLPEASPGTELTADRTPDGHLRVIYQGRDFSTRQVTTRNNWGDDHEIVNARTYPGSAFSLINIDPSKVDLRLYTSEKNDSNNYGELANTGGEVHAWSGIQTLGKGIPLTKIAVVTWGSPVQAIRVYTQAEGNDIHEQRWGEGANWRAGHHIPTA